MAHSQQADDDASKLEFFEAMRDFRKMFPRIEDEVIEAVLRANNGAVDDTIDQLLVMSLEKEENVHAETVPKRIGDLETAVPRVDMNPVHCAAKPLPRRETPASAVPAQNLIDIDDITLANFSDSTDVNNQATAAAASSATRSPLLKKKIYRPPLVGELPADFLRLSSSADPWEQSSSSQASSSHTYATRRSTVDVYDQRSDSMGHDGPPPSYAVAVGRRHSEKLPAAMATRRYRSPQHTYLGVFRTSTMRPATSTRRTSSRLAPTAETLKEAWEENEWKRRAAQDPELSQYLDDERIAIMLQNEEFMRHLRNDHEFLAALERDAAEASKKRSPRKSSSSRYNPQRDYIPNQSLAQSDPISLTDGQMEPELQDPFPYTKTLSGGEDSLDRGFQEKLALMGRTSKRKFATLARRFISKTRGAKGVLDNNDSRTHALLLASDDESDGTNDRDDGYNQGSDVDYNIGRRKDLKEGRFF